MEIKRLKELFATVKKRWWLLLLAAVGVALLFFGSGEGQAKTEEASLAAAETYRAELEERVTALCTHVAGVSDVRVLLTLSSGEVRVYAEDAGGGVVTAGGDAVLSAYAFPEVIGVAVVCRGGGDDRIRRELTELLSAALGISSARIHISAAG